VSITIRPAEPTDLPLINALIRELAEYERLLDDVRFEEESLGQYLFGPKPMVEVLIGEVDGAACGFALFFHNFSTFEGRPGIYLEDLFVREPARGRGLGKALFAELARLATARGCVRLEWAVLDWNAPSIAFYRKLGARSLNEWIGMRLSGAELRHLAGDEQASH